MPYIKVCIIIKQGYCYIKSNIIRCPEEGCNTNAVLEIAKLRRDHWTVKCSLGQYNNTKKNCLRRKKPFLELMYFTTLHLVSFIKWR